jgi:asparagine synthase (glutamine-hydrolysing)
MCGIAGIAAFATAAPPSVRQIEAMCASIVHRGPDDQGIEVRDGVGLGMRRLSIIDLAGGHQPIGNEDGSIKIVFNGEIYNFRELRRELEARGHRFATNSDTEVIVHAYEEFGVRCPDHLNGMFAFAIHDAKRRRVFLARDHLGIKPLYYAFSPTHLVWGSEIKALLASNLVGRDLDMDALGQFLSWEYVPGEATLFRGIRKLGAGCYLELDLDQPRCEPAQYWDVPKSAETLGRSEAEWIEAVDAKLASCVQRQLVSDVPLGAFLSGGVDSSAMTASMGRATTFSIGFDDATYNELKWARRVATHLGLDHHDEVLRPSTIELFHKLMHHMDDPIGDFSIFPTYLVSRLARERVKVVLSGDGGDELFGGYETYAADRVAQRLGWMAKSGGGRLLGTLGQAIRPRSAKKGLVNKAKRFLEGLSHPPKLGHARWRLFLGEEGRQALFTKDALETMETPVEAHIVTLLQQARHLQPVNRGLYVDLKSYLCDNILVKVDRMSMATSLEARVPYLDKELVELAFQIPDDYKLDGMKTKPLLKAVASRHVPAECVYRPKEGFSIPIKNWLSGEIRPLMEDLLNPKELAREGIFQAAQVERWKDEHVSGSANHSHGLWSLMVFQAWRRLWLEG